jgi:hypothetical protein
VVAVGILKDRDVSPRVRACEQAAFEASSESLNRPVESLRPRGLHSRRLAARSLLIVMTTLSPLDSPL